MISDKIYVIFITQALAYYDRSIQFNDKDESAFVNRAITKAVIKDHIGALKDFSKALAISPKSAHIYFNRANLHSTMGMYNEIDNVNNLVLIRSWYSSLCL